MFIKMAMLIIMMISISSSVRTVMNGDAQHPTRPHFTPLGSIEPHRGLLTEPPEGQLVYKVMTLENCLRSITGSYLHFNRVDSYADFPGADLHDGRQLPADLHGNAGARFLKAPDYSAADY